MQHRAGGPDSSRDRSASGPGRGGTPAGSGVTASDEQVRVVVEAAERLGRRQRDRCAGVSTSASDDRLSRLDWAVRAGRLLLADRAEGTRTPGQRSRSAP